jgi:enoyl-CoA hydratase
MGIAKELILGGGQIDAKRAYEIGLVNKVVPAAQLMDDTKKFAKKLAGLPGFALKMAKYSINYGYDVTLDNANRLEMECCAQ